MTEFVTKRRWFESPSKFYSRVQMRVDALNEMYHSNGISEDLYYIAGWGDAKCKSLSIACFKDDYMSIYYPGTKV